MTLRVCIVVALVALAVGDENDSRSRQRLGGLSFNVAEVLSGINGGLSIGLSSFGIGSQGGVSGGPGGFVGNPGFVGGDPGFGGVNPGLGGVSPGFGGVNSGFGGGNPGLGGVNPGFGGVNPGFGGANPVSGGAPSSGCRYWCKTPEGAAYCCENVNQPTNPIATQVVKPGQCPPVRPVCPRVSGPPATCSNDGVCGGADKCCFDRCLGEHVCKPPLGFGR
ncbi:uncharacterized protein LOC143019075 [Oratosquilla oratoria]|uniref:uncharacterized protein LOC143019075 n=1 Tax=Oratosquilla oratoria TaxID=337810 RepID=UPI003F775224